MMHILCNFSEILDKKLSYCYDSRSYWMQYFSAIHCDRTSRPLN